MCYIIEMELYVGDIFIGTFYNVRIVDLDDDIITIEYLHDDMSIIKDMPIDYLGIEKFNYMYDCLCMVNRKKILFQKEIGKL